MWIQEAEIRNFKGITNWKLSFRPGFNLIKGENGKGKTSILEALAVGLGGYLLGIDGVNTRHISKEEIRRSYSRTGEGTFAVEHHLPTQVCLTVDMEDGKGSYTWTRGRSSIQASRSTTQPRNIVKIAEEMSNQIETELPLISYQSAGRVWSQKREKTEDVFRKKYLRTIGYMDSLVEVSNIKLLLNWCVKMELVAWQKGKKISEYEAVKKAVADFMSAMDHNGCYEVFYDKQIGELMYEEGGKILPVSDLSSGYQSLIWMVFDIAYRMALLNPFLLDNITMTHGVVLIDELDMHLHPKWQWKVIQALRNTFPNIQFIAATHAPILFASAENVWLIDIEGDEPQYCNSHYGVDVNTAVRQFQGNFELPEEIGTDVKEFYEAMDREDYKKAKQLLDAVSEKTAPEFPLIADMRAMYDIETEWPEK